MIAWLKRAVGGGKRFEEANARLETQLQELEGMDDALNRLCEKLDGVEIVSKDAKQQREELRKTVSSYRPPSLELHIVPPPSPTVEIENAHVFKKSTA